jgi:tetratricopeptide (TPR) repeat protein
MEISEEKELKKAKEKFAKAVELFKKRSYQEALPGFESIINEYKDSQFYSILEIENRSNAYRKICEQQLDQRDIELNSHEDYLLNGIFNLNAGNLDEALERFEYLEKETYQEAYVKYLIALAKLKGGDKEEAFKFLEMAVKQDETYKIIAHNEPDFDPVFEDEAFTGIVEMEGNESGGDNWSRERSDEDRIA